MYKMFLMRLQVERYAKKLCCDQPYKSSESHGNVYLLYVPNNDWL